MAQVVRFLLQKTSVTEQQIMDSKISTKNDDEK